ncbi:hypothetical protein G6L94_12605 [Agrobacterium rhizogenes]|uniref:hypothetical protein n=1 Tax=Rhizobium rhizogenes TaxID=359 RepID=UPI0004D8EAC1|nr:hypothetical protein [Rhizobium rhizogenes]KAA6490130.1 hypothetical protein DXT98_07085 [Agrobacterium sp. ICMP 7243]OCJ14786.1 hypothetical protein A6U89_21990 [Agrobacterium sp. B133/95]KEA06288.1 hypothetical protein CN09_04690 [Rhizobium rhizogenes]MQB30160.1 hypothetical protein [Rhizobium rhizogenes]NTF49021.1 hypothetical protein [Rhizobium rhizogenes]
MAINEFLDALGIKVGVVIAGLSGGILRGLSRRRYTAREIIAFPICGALAAAYLTEPALYYLRAVNWPLPQKDLAAMNATAFVVGVCAMWIADLIFDSISRWIRGGKAVP